MVQGRTGERSIRFLSLFQMLCSENTGDIKIFRNKQAAVLSAAYMII